MREEEGEGERTFILGGGRRQGGENFFVWDRCRADPHLRAKAWLAPAVAVNVARYPTGGLLFTRGCVFKDATLIVRAGSVSNSINPPTAWSSCSTQ